MIKWNRETRAIIARKTRRGDDWHPFSLSGITREIEGGLMVIGIPTTLLIGDNTALVNLMKLVPGLKPGNEGIVATSIVEERVFFYFNVTGRIEWARRWVETPLLIRGNPEKTERPLLERLDLPSMFIPDTQRVM